MAWLSVGGIFSVFWLKMVLSSSPRNHCVCACVRAHVCVCVFCDNEKLKNFTGVTMLEIVQVYLKFYLSFSLLSQVEWHCTMMQYSLTPLGAQ